MEKFFKNHPKMPNYDKLRSKKAEYRQIPIDERTELYSEPLLGIYSHGLAGQSYYSRPNPLTVEPIPGVPAEPILRTTVLEKLAELNKAIKADQKLTGLFGGQVELYVEEGTRLLTTQKMLYNQGFPKLIRQQYPDATEDQVKAKLADLIAIPSDDINSPSPHTTGATFDVTLRYCQDDPGYITGQQEVYLRRFDGDVTEANFPDYFEKKKHLNSEQDEQIKQNRQIFHSIMTGEYFGYETEFACNPTEWWHWSYGDQLWAFVKDRPTAFYSIAK